ncbi:MAG TPA: pyridoxamine 5'-phosphate oxidase family protein [Planctomycetota bacterium]|jgi:nitroimidazol reductase NimA-like FMN-containing flavoprotein (pyridoxamine 5'-phosphate oxidase superfamily)
MIEMSAAEINGLLNAAHVGRIAMATPGGEPYVIPMPFCWHDGAIYLRLPDRGRKAAILRENDRVCFEADTYADDLSDYASVLIEGRLVPVSDLSEKARVKKANDEKYLRLRRGFRPGHQRPVSLSELPLQKILISELSGRKKEPRATAVVSGSATKEE